jgi:GNAT superfamily N-acetyltransferase
VIVGSPKGPPLNYRIEFDPTGRVGVARLYFKGLLIAHSYIGVDGPKAELVDIWVADKLPARNRILRAFGIRQSCRGHGAGTILLDEVCRQLAATGVAELWGKIQGDSTRLARWYQRLGFSIDASSGKISKNLVECR